MNDDFMCFLFMLFIAPFVILIMFIIQNAVPLLILGGIYYFGPPVFRGILAILDYISERQSYRRQREIHSRSQQHRRAELARREQLQREKALQRQEAARIANEKRQRVLREASRNGRADIKNLNGMMLKLHQTISHLQASRAPMDEILRLQKQLFDLEDQKTDLVQRLDRMGVTPPKELVRNPCLSLLTRQPCRNLQ
ncbi:MAG: hypothetical protein LAT83_19655 [Kiritimatiellae bacterium]|nr:hypothetical protein [Kiritimatiellia bacterium]